MTVGASTDDRADGETLSRLDRQAADLTHPRSEGDAVHLRLGAHGHQRTAPNGASSPEGRGLGGDSRVRDLARGGLSPQARRSQAGERTGRSRVSASVSMRWS
jgi:hypothetical protein